MYEYEIWNEVKQESIYIWGYNVKDAFRRHPELNPKEWKIICSEYID